MLGLKIAVTGLVFFISACYILTKLPDGCNPPLWVQACLGAAFWGGAAAAVYGLLFFVWQL